MDTIITVKNLKKSFKDTEVFKDFSIDFLRGKITAIFGPNGSGKSTLLDILAGIVPKDGGEFEIKDFDSFTFSYIFQNYRDSLLPWRNNFKNVALPLQIQKKSNEEIEKKVTELQALFEFQFDWRRYPYELSGGQQQILAFMRALVTNPKVLFIDEPFSALDYENNLRLRKYLQKYFLKYKPTVLLVTHNIEEAVHLADKIIVFSQKPTKVVQIIENSLPCPRTLDSLKTEHFKLIKDSVLCAFQKSISI